MTRWLRFFGSAVIDILLLISVYLAAGQFPKGCAMTQAVIYGVGPAVLDQRIDVAPSVFSEGAKIDVLIQDSLGGGCLNSLRAAEQLGMDCRPVVFVGKDPARWHLGSLLKEEFPQAITLPLLKQTRRSVLCGDTCATLRPPMVRHTLPGSVCDRLRKADLAIMAPLTGRDTAVVADVLQLAGRSVLQLSDSQLVDAETAAQLSRLATWTVINRRELSIWSGCESLEAGLLVLHGLGVENLLVTGADGVTILEGGSTSFQASHLVDVTNGTVGAGDVFTGTFAAMLADGQSVDEAVRLAQTAAAMHLSGMRSANSPEQLLEAAEEIPARHVKIPALPFRDRNRRPAWSLAMKRTIIAATLIVGTLLSLSPLFV